MTEKQLRQFITQKLGLEGWIVWFAPRVKFRKQQDIFTMWDGIAAKEDKVKFIQFTTKSNKAAHINKIKKFKKLYNLTHTGELWLYNLKSREFEIICL
jgi:hypothetical protein